MIDVGALGEGLSLLLSWPVVVAILVGATLGLILGAIPGIMGPVAMAALLPATFTMEPIVAILLLSSIYTGSVLGGSVSAVLMNMPGQPGSEATALEGFPMTRQGKHGLALGLALYSSVAAVFISYALVLVLLGPATRLAENLGPADRVSIALCALMIVAGLRGSSFIRGLMAGGFGLMLGTLGPTQGGIPRMGFIDVRILYEGLPLVPTILGLIAFSELIGLLREQYVSGTSTGPKVRAFEILRSAREWLRYYRLAAFASVVGFIIGVVPAAGATVASMFTYGQVRSWSKDRSKFGKGAPEGLVSAETANNAAEGGAMLIMFSLGIPGTGAVAILMSGFLMFGLVPGPVWITQNLDFAYGVILGNMLLAIIGIPVFAFCMTYLSRLVLIPTQYLAPTLAIVSSAGIYSLRRSLVDVAILWLFAYVGWLLKRHGFPPMAVLLGFILGPIVDGEMYRVFAIYGDVSSVVTRPVVLGSIVVSVLLLGNELLRAVRGTDDRIDAGSVRSGGADSGS